MFVLNLTIYWHTSDFSECILEPESAKAAVKSMAVYELNLLVGTS